ncbi:RloB family protein [Vibrio parahaemolyticus]|uniref:RloB family protein n=2 Tax=Vibrio parahaemolyticus TaxID=670 RepID=UPI001E45C49D|nr:RloB family protein [Vibrio parahaemolyticus]EJB8504268.1 RloB domain-containing protein [Vibrio parahaemolyticus]
MMGSDDLFKRSKARKDRSLKRQASLKQEYEKFLIVSEDTKSSVYYLQEAVSHYRIHTANFSIVGLGRDPLDIVDDAEARYNKELGSHLPDFDKVYCVFDRDSFSRYYNALAKVDAINKRLGKEVFFAITSDPSFELWLLLHFAYTSKGYAATQRKSSGDQVYDDLLQHYPEYGKNSKGHFAKLLPLIDEAIENAANLREYSDNSGSTTHTRMGELMAYIKDLKNQ